MGSTFAKYVTRIYFGSVRAAHTGTAKIFTY